MDADAPEAAGTVAEGGSAARATRWSVLERIIGLTKDRDNKVVGGSSTIAQCKAVLPQQLPWRSVSFSRSCLGVTGHLTISTRQPWCFPTMKLLELPA